MVEPRKIVLRPKWRIAAAMSIVFLSLPGMIIVGAATSPDFNWSMILEGWPLLFFIPFFVVTGVYFLFRPKYYEIMLDENGISYGLKPFRSNFRHEASWDRIGHVRLSYAGFMAGYQVWGTTNKGKLLRFQFGGAFTNERQAIMYIVDHIDKDRVHDNIFAAIEKWKRKGLV